LQDSELNYFKEMLESRKKQILSNISGVNDELNQLNSLELNDDGDHASVGNSSMVESAIVQQQKKELSEIDNALGKIRNNLYGICEMCDEEIDTNRLEVKCYAKFCIDCREIYEKTSNKDKNEI